MSVKLFQGHRFLKGLIIPQLLIHVAQLDFKKIMLIFPLFNSLSIHVPHFIFLIYLLSQIMPLLLKFGSCLFLFNEGRGIVSFAYS